MAATTTPAATSTQLGGIYPLGVDSDPFGENLSPSGPLFGAGERARLQQELNQVPAFDALNGALVAPLVQALNSNSRRAS